MRRSIRIAMCVAFAGVAFCSGEALASPIITFSGSTTPITDSGSNFFFSNQSSINLTNVTITALSDGTGPGTVVLAAANQLTNSTVSMTGSASGFANESPTTIAFSVPNTGFVTPFGTENGGTVTFQAINPFEVVGAGTTTTFGSLNDSTPELKLTGNTSNLDFGPIGGLFHFQISTQGLIYNSAGNGSFSTQDETLANGSFSAKDAPPVPEPASLAVWGLFGVAGAWYGFRRVRREPATV
jgi:hypothetical protein